MREIVSGNGDVVSIEFDKTDTIEKVAAATHMTCDEIIRLLQYFSRISMNVPFKYKVELCYEKEEGEQDER